MPRSFLAVVFAALVVVWLVPAHAAGDPFKVKDIKVDATAASASEAFTIAVNDGRRKAWTTLMHRLTREQDWPNIPMIDDATLQQMTMGYQISDEMRSTTRYVADVTYTFNGKLVRRFLQNANIAYADSAAKPLLVIPMAPSYAPDSDWTMAWSGGATANTSVPMKLPRGDALDRSTLGALNFGTASWNEVQSVAARAQADQAALVQAGPVVNGQMVVKIRLLSPTVTQSLPPVSAPVPAGATAQTADAAAATAAAQALGNIWKTRAAVDFNRQSQLTADVRVNSVAQWGVIRQHLAKVPVVTDVKVAAMDIGQARIVIGYAGTPAQLNDFLSQAALQLSRRDGVWWLSMQPSSARTGGP